MWSYDSVIVRERETQTTTGAVANTYSITVLQKQTKRVFAQNYYLKQDMHHNNMVNFGMLLTDIY